MQQSWKPNNFKRELQDLLKWVVGITCNNNFSYLLSLNEKWSFRAQQK